MSKDNKIRLIVFICGFLIILGSIIGTIPSWGNGKVKIQNTDVVIILEKVAPDGTSQNIELKKGFKYNLKYFEEIPIKEK